MLSKYIFGRWKKITFHFSEDNLLNLKKIITFENTIFDSILPLIPAVNLNQPKSSHWLT